MLNKGIGGTGIVNLTSAVRVSSRIDNDKSMKSIDSNNHVSVAVEPRSKQKGKKKSKKEKSKRQDAYGSGWRWNR